MTPIEFVTESLRIEGIYTPPEDRHIKEFERFMKLKSVQLYDLYQFVYVYEPGAVLRDQYGLDVIIGNYRPPRGSHLIKEWLMNLLDSKMSAYEKHIAYEMLHPFTDCNGRSGRMLWAHAMGRRAALQRGFLHTFYYQCLSKEQSNDNTRPV